MELIYRLDVKVTAPTKTTTGIVLEALGVRVERSAGSVQRALEEALVEFGHQLRVPLLKEARAARAQTTHLPPEAHLPGEATVSGLMEREDGEPEAIQPDHALLLFSEGSGVLATLTDADPPKSGTGLPAGAAGPEGYISGLTVPPTP